ncbi:NnrS family protein [Cohaesibacter sp. CAU 1516]|uniref:NnrS family protein n=1 Tax=Cohaesibacter sp. CAU 1516 TaxID=2576038 RepID=UPI0010FF4EE7|nr:NnrS family protein [Cohaesibacter sp. CAU 1516]TLP49154.1 NnrS family protein [Cohaesibacter sp. CAU 1516]
MSQSTADQMRRWQGPAILSYGFRPFFLLGAIWASVAVVVWILALSGNLTLSSEMDPVSWHAHAFLFGYTGAIIAGFLLTAVPNWTGRLPVIGWALAGLVGLWIAGRIGILFSQALPYWVVIVGDLAFPIVLGLVILREIVAGKNWRNLIILLLLVVFTLANLLFHIDVQNGYYAAQGYGARLGLAAVLLMIGVIGGRIVPSFTRNWLVREGYKQMPAAPMQRLDKLVLLVSIPAFIMWVLWPDSPLAAALLFLFGVGHTARLGRWKGWFTRSEPLVVILHLAYLFLPLGAFAMTFAIVRPDILPASAAQHLWMAGALGGMTLAVMTRASLGHTGQPLHSGIGTSVIYLAIMASTIVRFIAGFWPEDMLYHMAGGLWFVAFAGFAMVYGPLLLRPRS